MSDAPLDAASIRAHLIEVAELLPPGEQHMILMVGGSLLAWHGLRRTTFDVDSVRPVDGDLKLAVEQAARGRGLPPAWLNDRASAFQPSTLREGDCDVLLDHPRLLVLGAPLDQVFLMKLNASRSRDVTDLVELWPHCSFTSAADAVARFYEAYPFEEPDPHLVDFVAQLIPEST